MNMPVESVPLERLTPAPWNPRTIRDERFKNLCASIEADPDFLWRRPILAMADGTIYAGNMRYRAANHLQMGTVPAIIEDVSEQLAKERALRDNAQWGDWENTELAVLVGELESLGADTGLLGIEPKDLGRFVSGGSTVGLKDPDDVPEPPADPRAQVGDLWILGEHRVLCGDSTNAEQVARLMGSERASMVWTDPPYGVAIGAKNRHLNSIGKSNRVEVDLANDNLDEAGTTALIRESLTLAAAYCTGGGAWYVAAPVGPLHLRFGEVLRDLGVYRQTLIWVKNNATFAPLGVSYHWGHEPIFYGWLPGRPHRYFGDRKQTTVWQIDRPKSSPDHPTMKPVELVGRAIEHSSQRGELVYEPFSGSGTTIIACEQLGRRCYAMEIEPRYVDVAVRRWEDFTGRTAVVSR